MNIPATKRLLAKELTTIISKMQVVIPKIPDVAYREDQQRWLMDTVNNFELHRANEDDLKRLLMRSKSNIFSFQLKYPELKKAYDGADILSNVNSSSEEEKQFLTEKDDYALRKKAAEFKMKKLQNYELFGTEDEKGEDSLAQKQKEIDSLRKMAESIDKATDEFSTHSKKYSAQIKQNETKLKEMLDKLPKFKEKNEFVEREENTELQEQFKENQKKWEEHVATHDMKEGDKIYNFSPFSGPDSGLEDNSEQTGIQGPGVYVLRNGKLVKGEGQKREEVMFSNWY